MIIRLNSEANLVKATEVKLIKTSDYQDTLTFKLPLDEQIFVDELVGVRTKVMKQDYRVKEIITKDRFKDVYCEHKFFDCKNIVIPFIDEAHRAGESYNDFSRYNSLQSIVGHLNRIMRTKGDTEFKFSTDIDKSGVVECDDTPLFDLIFGEKGILKTFNVELVYDNYKVKFVEKRPSKNTEILFHENKNVSELQETIDFKEIITKLHVTCKYTPDKTEEGKAERERLRAEKRRELFNKSQEKIKAREARQAQERALRRQKQEEAYQASRTAPKKTREQIHAEHLRKQQDTENRILTNNESRRQERERKFNEREQQRVSKQQNKEDLIFRTVFVSPLVSRYARPYEASLNFQSSEINSEAALIAWCNANLFTDEDTRDVPLRNFSFKPVEDDYNVDINDRAMVNFTSIGTTKIVHCCKIEYDALHDKYLNIEFGVLNKSAIRETIGALNAKISETNSNILRTYDILDKNFDDYVQKELEAYSELFNIDKGEIEDTINQGFEDAKIEAEKVYGNINTDIENKLAPIREDVRNTVEAYNQQLQATKQELEKNKTDSIEKLKELTDRVNNVQDISTNPTVLELKQQVAEAKESGNSIKSKVTELEGSITREFSSVKSKTENDLNVVKAEFTRGVDGLTRKISSLEEYKNQDGSRTESLKQWVQRDTASQLSRERTEINRIVDSKGYVKNTEFSSKFNDNAQGINRKLDALETYKNQDGTRTSALKQWTQDNTASQLATARRSIESWVDNKGYVTTSVVNNKVQETANSFSREISNVRESIPTSLGGRNYITDSKNLKAKTHWGSNKWDESVDGDTIILTKKDGSDKTGFWFNLTDLVKTQFQNETLTWSIDIKASRNITLNSVGFESNGQKRVDISTNWTRISHTFVNRFSKFYTFTFYEPTTNFNNGDKIYIRLPKLEKGNIATDWTPAPEDDQQSINDLNSWKQTTTGTLNTVTNTLNDTVRHSQLQITADSINFGSNKIFNGKNLASMLSVSPDSIKAITDKLVISPANENLVLPEHRDTYILNVRNGVLNKIYGSNTDLEGEYYFKLAMLGWDTPTLYASIHVTYTDGKEEWFNSEFPTPNLVNFETSTSVKVQVKSTKKIKYIEPLVYQNKWSDFYSFHLKKLFVGKKKSAELIVDGTIEGKHIKSSTIETGHLKTGSVTANIIASDAIESKHMKVDDAMIDKIVGNQAFVSKLWAREAFINNLESVKIKSTQIDTNTLQGVRITGGVIDGGEIIGETKIKLGQHGFLQPVSQGLQINAPASYNANNGVGFQIHGYKKTLSNGNYVPKGVFIYNDDNFSSDEAASTSNETLLTVEGMVYCRSMSDGNGKYHKGYAVPTITTFDENHSGLFPIFNIYHQDDYRGQYFSYSVPGKYFSVATKSISDVRFKKNIKQSKENALRKIDMIDFKAFDWKEKGKGHEKLGMIAQELEKIESKFVDLIKFGDGTERYTLNTDNLNIYSLKAIQELSTENKELKQRIIKLEEKVNG
nr:MAG TPA: Neck appendage protein [Caudoviricetes sp.]